MGTRMTLVVRKIDHAACQYICWDAWDPPPPAVKLHRAEKRYSIVLHELRLNVYSRRSRWSCCLHRFSR